MLLLCIYGFLLAFYSPLSLAAPCKSSVIPVQVVTNIQQCVCNAQEASASCCDAASSLLDNFQSQVNSLIDVIDDLVGDISNFDTFISQYDILVEIARNIDLDLVRSLVDTVFSIDSSLDHITSLIDVDIAVDENILPTVSVIDTNVETIASLVDNLNMQNCASTNDLIASDLEQLSEAVQDLENLLEQISDIDDVIISHMGILDTKVDDVQSMLDILVANQACSSRQDMVISSLDSLQQQEASCCQQLFQQLTTLQEDVDSRLDDIASISLIEEITDILSVVGSLKDQFVSYIDISQSGFDYITSRLDVLQACAPISLEVQGPVTLATPGNYCLTSDGAGDITIASSGIQLNLNNHVLSGSITVNAGLQDISIYNGRLNGSGSNGGVIINQTCNNILLLDLFIYLFQHGIHLAGVSGSPVTNVLIDSVTTYQCANYGFHIVESSGKMINSVAFENEVGVRLDNSHSFFIIDNMQAVRNGAVGFSLENTSNFGVLSVAIYNSIAYGSLASGFYLNNGVFYLENCLSQGNAGVGFSVGDGLVPTDNQGAIVNCQCVANSGGGFLVSNLPGTEMGFVGNYSANNTMYNYAITNGNSFVSVGQNQSPYYWLFSNGTSTNHNNVIGV